MPDTFAKVGNNLRLYFLVRNASTGRADNTFLSTDFSLKIGKDLVGNQATTGCTFGVLDATNNPGIGYIDCSGSTSFVSSTGNYPIEVTRLTDLTKIWTQTVRVTSDGTGAGTWGTGSFTAVASNGRITSGGSGIAGVTVRLLTSAGNVYLQTTTDSNGLWGTVYFVADGTYTISAQLSGYTIGTGTITVTSGVATGPGADIAITASSSTNTILASDLWAYARRMLTDNVGSKADTEIQQAVDDALGYLSMTKQWPYLLTLGRIDLQPAYTTGTCTVANASTTVTFSGATLPTWAASAVIYINGAWATISTRDSATQVTLTGAWGEASATAASYTLVQYSYALPTNCTRINKVMFASNWPYEQEVSASRIEYLRTIWQIGGSYPNCWGISGGNFLVWPFPSATVRVNLLYYKRPALLVNGADVAEWDPMQLMVLRRAIDYQCSLRGECVAGTPKECMEALDHAIDTVFEWDKTGDMRTIEGESPSAFYGDDWLRGTVS